MQDMDVLVQAAKTLIEKALAAIAKDDLTPATLSRHMRVGKFSWFRRRR